MWVEVGWFMSKKAYGCISKVVSKSSIHTILHQAEVLETYDYRRLLNGTPSIYSISTYVSTVIKTFFYYYFIKLSSFLNTILILHMKNSWQFITKFFYSKQSLIDFFFSYFYSLLNNSQLFNIFLH